MDFDLEMGFFERCGQADISQAGGRVGRNEKYLDPVVYDFTMKKDPYINSNPMFNNRIRVLGEMIEEGKIGPEYVTEALKRELNISGMSEKAEALVVAWKKGDFEKVNRNFRVINDLTQIVVVDPDLISRLEQGVSVLYAEMMQGSVQMWTTSKRNEQFVEIIKSPDYDEDEKNVIYKWTGEYDSFLGYMTEVLNAMDEQLAADFL